MLGRSCYIFFLGESVRFCVVLVLSSTSKNQNSIVIYQTKHVTAKQNVSILCTFFTNSSRTFFMLNVFVTLSEKQLLAVDVSSSSFCICSFVLRWCARLSTALKSLQVVWRTIGFGCRSSMHFPSVKFTKISSNLGSRWSILCVGACIVGHA